MKYPAFRSNVPSPRSSARSACRATWAPSTSSEPSGRARESGCHVDTPRSNSTKISPNSYQTKNENGTAFRSTLILYAVGTAVSRRTRSAPYCPGSNRRRTRTRSNMGETCVFLEFSEHFCNFFSFLYFFAHMT